jgi:NADH:ubiquinone oxidoreductase subunit F (NADH-binding)/ferredoxin
VVPLPGDARPVIEMPPAVRPWQVLALGEPRLTAGLGRHDRLGLGAHLAVHGALPRLTLGTLVALAMSVDARGRGGAAFPLARKLRAAAASGNGKSRVIVVNAMEGEPGSAKDQMLLTRVPHLVLDGALLAAAALDTREVIVGVPAGSPGEAAVARALAERPDCALPGMPGSSGPLVWAAALPDRFVAGESGALVRALSGGPGLPPGRKQRATERGVRGGPTLLSNAETFAQLAVLARLGAGGYRGAGTASEPGTVLLTVGGCATRPAVVEVPSGTPLPDVLAACGAQEPAAVLTGGFHGTWLGPVQAAAAAVSREGLSRVGGVLGPGVVLPLGAGTCAAGEVTRVAWYLGLQSSGQCGPCRLGLPGAARALAALADGTGGPETLAWLRRTAAGVRGRGACSHPDGTSRFIASALDTFADEIAAHAGNGSCGRPVLRQLPVPEQPGHARLAVDWARCRGHGLCASVAPEIVSLDDHGYPVIADAAVPPWLTGTARQAVRACPALALRLT